MKFEDAVAAIDARTNYEASGRLVSPSLDRIRAAAELLDHPQRSFPSIHVTGTNGKGTTVAIASALLRELGLGVGAYTSPHLHSIRERIVFDGSPITEEDFAETYAYLEPYLRQVDEGGKPVTWFETVTLLSWLYFAEKAVDAAVVEVGMGGEWDATNLIDGRVAVITNVSLDHRELGETTVEVAHEKSGIVKHGGVCVTAEPDPDVIEVIRKRAVKEGATLRRHGAEFALERRSVAIGGQSLRVRVGDHVYDDLFLPLYGEQLALDAAIALAAVEAFLGDRPLDEDVVRAAFAVAASPGRLEVLRRSPLVVVDGAHNAAAGEGLATAMAESFTYDSLTLVVGMLGDHFKPEVLRTLVTLASDVIATQPDSPRAMAASALADEIAALGANVRVEPDVATACDVALGRVGTSGAVLVTGSLYVVASARAHILGLSRP